MSASINKPSPWAVVCSDHGQQFLTEEDYDNQMMKADCFWLCPVCGRYSAWDDDNYDNYNDGEE